MSLYDYYKSIGKSLPSVQERAGVAAQYGITNYTGTAVQNNQLEAKLRAGGSTPTQQQPTNQTPTPTPSSGSTNQDLVAALVAKGYNQIDAENAAKNDTSGNLAKEYLGSAGGNSSVSLGTTQNINLMDTYDKYLEDAGISNVEASIVSKQNEITAMKNAAADREAEVNENPFLSESSRVGRIQKINDNLAKKLAPLETEVNTLSNQVTAKRNEVLNKLNLNVQQVNLDNTAAATSLSRFNTLLSAGALSNLSATDIAKLSTETGLPVSMINGAIASSKAGEPYITTQTDNSGNVTAIVIDKKTGKLVSTTSLGKIGEAKVTSPNSTQVKQQYADLAKSDARNGVTLQQMLQIYGGYLDANDIYALYNSNSIYGPAKETDVELQKYGINTKAANASSVLQSLLNGG